MKTKVKFINKSKKSKCFRCEGSGLEDITKITNITKCEACKTCKGKGYWIENNFILIAIDNKGQKIAFMVDGLK